MALIHGHLHKPTNGIPPRFFKIVGAHVKGKSFPSSEELKALLAENFSTIAREVARGSTAPWTDRFNEDMWGNSGPATY